MIYSVIENDIYKFSMSNFYQQIYPEACGTFVFRDRNNTKVDQRFVEMVRYEISTLNNLRFTRSEFDWCVENIPYIPQRYWEWLRDFKYNSQEEITVRLENGELCIEATGRMDRVTLYEVPILAIVSECYYRRYQTKLTDFEGLVINPLLEKIKFANENEIKFAAFGMRRRFSHHVEDQITQRLAKDCCSCVGTSTVLFAKEYNLKPLGTMAHELFMATAALVGPKEANFVVMENWSKVYDGNLGTVLTDTFTVDVFLRNFSMKLAKLYDSVRHDSGDPIIFGEKIIDKYKSYNIDPTSKTIIFSDALNFPRAVEINNHFKDRIKVSFGIGTNITNDIKGYKPMNIVMKLKDFQVNLRQPLYGCVKLSDNPSKAIGVSTDIENYKYQLGL